MPPPSMPRPMSPAVPASFRRAESAVTVDSQMSERARRELYELTVDNQEGLESQMFVQGGPATPVVSTPAKTHVDSPSVAPTPNHGGRSQTMKYMDDGGLLRPAAGSLLLSEGAIDQRLRRLMTPRANGTHKISADIVDMYRAGGKGKQQVYRMFQAAGFDPDWF